MDHNQEKEILNRLDLINNITSGIKDIIIGKNEEPLNDNEEEKALNELLKKHNLMDRLRREKVDRQYIKDLITLISSKGLELKDLEETFNNIDYMNDIGKIGYLRGYIINSIKNIK